MSAELRTMLYNFRVMKIVHGGDLRFGAVSPLLLGVRRKKKNSRQNVSWRFVSKMSTVAIRRNGELADYPTSGILPVLPHKIPAHLSPSFVRSVCFLTAGKWHRHLDSITSANMLTRNCESKESNHQQFFSVYTNITQ